MTYHHIVKSALFVLTFSSTLVFINHQAGYPDLGALDEKLIHVQTHRDLYNVIFIGSSRMERGVVAPLFDREMQRSGISVRSFNLGLAGMKAHEANALIRRVLSFGGTRKPRWIVIEMDDWDPVIQRANRFKRRAIFWHDAQETLSALRSTLLLNDSIKTRMDLTMTHGLHFAARSLAVGRGLDAAENLLFGGEGNDKSSHDLVRWQGFKPYRESSYKYNPLRKKFLQELELYRQQVALLSHDDARLRNSDATSARIRSDLARRTRLQVEMVERAGMQPVHLITPVPQARPDLEELQLRGDVRTLLAFNQPRVYPRLFDVEHRFDYEHLTQEGAEAWTRLLAARLRPIISPQPVPGA